MSRNSSDSDEDDYRNSKSRHKRYRSDSDSSGDSHTQKRNNRRNRRSRTRSRDRNVSRSSRSQKDRYDSRKDRSRSCRSKSPQYRCRRQRSPSRSSSRSSRLRMSPNYLKGKSYRKSKRKYRSRSRSRSYSRRSRSRSRRRYRSRSRSRSSSCKKLKRSYGEENSSNSDEEIYKNVKKSRQVNRNTDSKKPSIPEESCIIISSDDPILKQEQLDEINSSSFTPKSFKSNKSDNTPSFPKHLLSSSNEDGITKNIDIEFLLNENFQKPDIENRKNETVFHDNIVFEDSEIKIQKWVKRIHKIRQKFLLTQQQ